jgi:hypothetical protein
MNKYYRGNMRESKVVITLERHVERLEEALQERERVIGELLNALMQSKGNFTQVDLKKQEERFEPQELETVPMPGESWP